MELYQLRTFVTVTEEHSISGAARRLAMTPSSVSTHIKALETELGVQLFVRTHQGVDLTDKGRILAEHARQTIQAADGLSQQANVLKQHIVGTMRFGLSVPFSIFDVPTFAQDLHQTYPELTLHLSQSESVAILHQLRYEALDMGIVFGQVNDSTIASHCLMQAELVVAIPRAWKHHIDDTWASLAQMAWINTGEDCPFQPLINDLCQTHQLQPKQLIRTDDEQTRFKLVQAGMGISLLEKTEATHPDLMIFDADPILCDVTLVYPIQRQFDPMIQTVRDVVLGVATHSTLSEGVGDN